MTIQMTRRASLLDLLKDSGMSPTDGSKNVMICCPMAPYTGQHRRLTASRPSMGIRHTDHGPFLVNCFTCGYRSTSLGKLFEDLAFKSHDNSYLKWVDKAVQLEQLDVDAILSVLDSFERGTKVSFKAKDQPIYNEEYKEYAGHYDHWYWETRGVRAETCWRWEVGFDEKRQRIVIPIRDKDNNIRGATGRSISEITKPKYHNYWEMGKGYWLLGESLCLGKSLIVVEGPLDALIVDQHLGELFLREEYSVVALMGSSFTKRQLDTMCHLATEIVFFMDRDESGRIATEKMAAAFQGRILTSSVQYGISTAKDPGSVKIDEFEKLLYNTRFL